MTEENNLEEEKTEVAEESTTEEQAAEPVNKDDVNYGLATGDSTEFKWYVAHALSGHENKVCKALKERILNHQLTEQFARILVPEESVVSYAGGKKRTVKKKFFPGYVLIKMIMSDKTWHLVKNTDKITGFLGGTSDKPSPISEDEVAYMLGQIEGGIKKSRTDVKFSEGDSVKVIEGPFASFVGTIEQVSDKGKVKVNVSIFGRPTPVELDFTQVEKVNS